jgi:cytochrome c oxidase subunit II
MNMKKLVAYVRVAVTAGLLLELMTMNSAAQDSRRIEQVIHISASSFEFKPSEITVKKGIPVTLEIVSQDHHHGFRLSEFHLRADIQPGVTQKIRFVPDKTGTFNFLCDVFCGEGHEEMSGTLAVVE